VLERKELAPSTRWGRISHCRYWGLAGAAPAPALGREGTWASASGATGGRARAPLPDLWKKDGEGVAMEERTSAPWLAMEEGRQKGGPRGRKGIGGAGLALAAGALPSSPSGPTLCRRLPRG